MLGSMPSTGPSSRRFAPALRAAGIEHRRIYDCRHTFATWAIESNQVPLSQLATIMGTSVVQLEDTYARWLTRTNDRLAAAFDAHDAKDATVDESRSELAGERR
jgi:integrase